MMNESFELRGEEESEGDAPTGDRGVTTAPTEGGGEVSGGAPTGEPHSESADYIRVARVRCLDEVKARGFTFARGKVVEGVPLAHAEYLAQGGKAEILEVSVSVSASVS